ncbi:MAG TPA: cistern family PEP-CTERM protein [Burkholderiales bacterium]
MLAIWAAPAQAVLISSSDPYNFSWSYDTGSYLLTGDGSLSVTGFNSSLLTIAVTLSNTAPNGGQGGDRLTAFGFGIDPNAISISFLDADDGGLTSADWSKGPLQSKVGVEICAFGGQNCAGGSNGGIYAGTFDSFIISLGGIWGSSVNIDPIGVRYQTGTDSYTFAVGTPPPTSVPEPATLTMLGAGLLALAATRRRKGR